MRLAVFDVDGTLADNTAIDDECFVATVAAELGRDDFSPDWSRFPQVTDPAVAAAVIAEARGRAATDAELAAFRRGFVARLAAAAAAAPARFAAVPGAPELLAALVADPGWSVAVATGAWGDAARIKLAAAGFDPERLVLATADDGSSRAAIVAAAIARAAGAFETVVLVGDALWDLETARRLGHGFVGRAVGERAGLLRRAGAGKVVASFLPLSAALVALAGARPPGPPRSAC